MRKLNKYVRLATVALALCGLATGFAAQASCLFTPPQGWAKEATRWDGDCLAGQADGVGVLKEFSGSSVKRFYFGSMKDGSPQLGVVDQTDGYIAGRFINGNVVASDERQDYVSAFAEAEKAANHVAGRFAKAGNKGSAAFYKGKAKALREQLD